MKTLKLGGQAVLEGVMIKSENKYAVSIRDKDSNIITKTWDYNHKVIKTLKKIIFLRGVVSLIESFYIGMKTFNYSSNFYLGEKENTNNSSNVLYVFLSLILAIFLFIFLPFFTARLFKNVMNNNLIVILEGLIRIFIFVGYILVISTFEDIKRVFMYHGAEHKCINCVENKKPLTVENARSSSRKHKRCGTSFIIFILLISLIAGFFINVDSLILKVLIRILLIPVIASISYEIIILSTKNNFFIFKMLSKIGLLFQKLTTKEPTDDMIEVAISSVNAVFDVEDYLKSE